MSYVSLLYRLIALIVVVVARGHQVVMGVIKHDRSAGDRAAVQLEVSSPVSARLIYT